MKNSESKKRYDRSPKGRAAAMRRWLDRRELLVAFKSRGCQLCGEMDPACIDTHHVNPEEKVFQLVQCNASRSAEKWIEELNKCIPLCSNCHRKLHARET